MKSASWKRNALWSALKAQDKQSVLECCKSFIFNVSELWITLMYGMLMQTASILCSILSEAILAI